MRNGTEFTQQHFPAYVGPSRLKHLHQQRADLVSEGRAMIDRAHAEKREFTAAEDNQFASIDANIKRVTSELATEEARREAQLASLTARTAPTTPLGKTYRDLFGPVDVNHGFKGGLNEYFSVLHSGLADARLAPAIMASSTHLEGIPSTGGFLVPEEFSAQMLDAAMENEIVRPRAAVFGMTSDTRKIAGLDGLDNSSGAPYGLAGQWLAEGSDMTLRQGKFRMVVLKANKLGILAEASNELVQDGTSFEQMLGQGMVTSISWNLDSAFLNGTGAGQPKGVLNDAALITVSKEAGQAAGTILPENLVKLFSRLHPSCVNNAVWVASSTIIPQLYLMKTTIKNVAGTENVGGAPWFIANGSGGPGGTLLGLPIVFTEKVPAVGSKGDILLADFSQYAVGLRKEVSIEKSGHVGFTRDMQTYRSVIRFDGMGLWSGPFTPKNGSTLSWCVTLEAR